MCQFFVVCFFYLPIRDPFLHFPSWRPLHSDKLLSLRTVEVLGALHFSFECFGYGLRRMTLQSFSFLSYCFSFVWRMNLDWLNLWWTGLHYVLARLFVPKFLFKWDQTSPKFLELGKSGYVELKNSLLTRRHHTTLSKGFQSRPNFVFEL